MKPYIHRLQQLRHAMKANHLDGIVCKDEKNRFYFTGFASSAGMVIITQSTAFFCTDMRYIEAAARTATHFTVALTAANNTETSYLQQQIEASQIKSLGFEGTMSFSAFARMQDALRQFDLKFSPCDAVMQTLRAQKGPEEADAIAQAQSITEQALIETLPLIRPGVTEREIAAELTYRQLRLGADAMSFAPIVASGARSSMPHAVPTDKPFALGEFITMDFGCVKNGYCSDMTRTVALGSVTDQMQTVYNTVLAAQQVGIDAARAGVSGRSIDAAGRAVIDAAGYGAYFGHSFGHGLGLDIHESPNASPNEETILPEGAVISAEPGIYIPGAFGVRIEDILYLTANGAKNLTKAEKSLLVL